MARVLIVDTLNSMYCLYHKKEPKAAFRFICDIRNIMANYSVDKVIFCNDLGKSKYRSELYPEYKVTREDKRKQLTEAEKRQLSKFFDEVKKFANDIAPLFGAPVIQEWGVESDDFIAALVNKADLTKHELMVLSTDTDLLQLVRKGVVQRSYASKMKLGNIYIPANVWVNRAKYVDVYNIEPHQYAFVKSFTGDTSDNIKGVFGLGDVNAFKLIQKYGDIEGVRDNIGNILNDIPKFPKKVISELENKFEVVELAYKLINLNHNDEVYTQIFSEDARNKIEEVLGELENGNSIDEEAIKDYLYEIGAVSKVVEFDNFIGPFWGK